MPIRSRVNQYRGLNAHLQSYLLNEPGGWQSFHADHIVQLCQLLDEQLPTQYYARVEKSIQISEHDLVSGRMSWGRTRPDVGIYRTGEQPSPAQGASPVAQPVATLPLEDALLLSEEAEIMAVVVYEVGDRIEEDVPVTRVELLSPTNKPPYTTYQDYLERRRVTLASGIRLVEIDYLHESRSPVRRLPSYPAGDPAAYPYLILVSAQQAATDAGATQVYGFRVDQRLLPLPLPLVGEEALVFDFGAAYHVTFSRNRFYGLRAVDYAELPVNFAAYQPDDQARIQAVMARVQAAVEAGDDLSQGPPLESDS